MEWADNPYLTFQDVTPEGRRTRIVEVIAVRDGALLGTIKWFGRWRKYAFFAEPGCVFEEGCLQTVLTNLVRLTDEHRQSLRPAAGWPLDKFRDKDPHDDAIPTFQP